MEKRITIDEEGYFVLENGARMSDSSYGHKLLSGLTIDDIFAVWTTSPPDEKILVEAFDKPLVVQNIEQKQDTLWALFPYDYSQEIDLKTLCLDDWGRLIGWTKNKVPFVFLKKAQNTFFGLVTVQSEDTIVWKNQTQKLEKYYLPLEEAAKIPFWEERYTNTNTPWDLNGPHPAIEPILQQLKLQKSRVLNLGCGRGHDAHLLAKKGHIVTAVDISPRAIQDAKTLYPKPPTLTFVEDDVFALKDTSKVDVIFEHTLFCAIPPEKRKDLIRIWKNTLDDTGYLLGVFFVHPKRFGPPYGCSEWELRELLEPHFRLMYWKRWEVSPSRRHGTELVIFAQKY
ncbi:MAG: methyltransferase domain-containing protein [Bdellovibrionaceae bacterium]|nr:methyltransferase domain-containing protein [Pseudobdellovibrionaceae bacterium]